MKIFHFYGTTPNVFGIEIDDDFITLNQLTNHFWNNTLNKLSAKYGYNCEVHMLTKAKKSKKRRLDNLNIIFHPIISLPIVDKFSLFKRGRHRISIKFLKYLNKNRPDLFVFYGGLSFLTLLYGFFLLKWNIPYIVLISGEPIKSFFSQQYIYKKAEEVIVLTHVVKSYLERKYKISSSNLSIIPVGINTKIYYPEVSMEGKNKNSPTICFVGRLSYMKGFEYVLECLRYIKNDFPNSVLEVAGEYIDKKYKKNMEAFIRRYNLRSSIVFHGWIREDNKLRKIYNRSDLLVFPSRSEGLPRTVLESMACGTPVVTLESLPGCCEVIQNGKNGILTDLENIKYEVNKILSNRERLKKMSACTRERIEKEYSFEICYPKAEKLYLGLGQ